MPSQTNRAHIDTTGIRQLDYISTEGLAIDPNSQLPGIESCDLPKSTEERAFEVVSQALGVDAAMLDQLQPADRIYFASLTTVLANCVVPGPNGEISTPDIDEALALHQEASQLPTGADTIFLQDLGILAKAERRYLLGPRGSRSQTTYPSASDFLEHVLDVFDIREAS